MIVDKSASAPSRAHTTAAASTTGVGPSRRADRATYTCAYPACRAEFTVDAWLGGVIYCSSRCYERDAAELVGSGRTTPRFADRKASA